MQILNIAGYKFINLNHLTDLQAAIAEAASATLLKGTVLLSEEGINLNLAGAEANIRTFLTYLTEQTHFADMRFHETYSDTVPFKVLKIKIKNEIITMREPSATPTCNLRAPAVSPEEFKQWLDEKRELTLLDTRNDYEYRFGTFKGAINLQINNFGELPLAITSLDKSKPVVMFCTGGVRCEKAGLYLEQHGFSEVYQLDTGIIGYFAKTGGAHFEGECFVFDERIAIGTNLLATNTVQCKKCSGPVNLQEQKSITYLEQGLCFTCS